MLNGKITIFCGKIHSKWSCSIAMLVSQYQRLPVIHGSSRWDIRHPRSKGEEALKILAEGPEQQVSGANVFFLALKWDLVVPTCFSLRLVNVPTIGDIWDISKTTICWRWYPYFCWVMFNLDIYQAVLNGGYEWRIITIWILYLSHLMLAQSDDWGFFVVWSHQNMEV